MKIFDPLKNEHGWIAPRMRQAINSITPALVHSANSAALNSISNALTVTSTNAQNLIVIGIHASNNRSISTITDNATGGSNTYVTANCRATLTGGGATEIWYAKNSRAGATAITVTLNLTSTDWAIWALEISGMNLSNPLDLVNSANNQGSSTILTCPTVTTTGARDFVFCVGFTSGTATGTQAGNPFTTLPIVSGDPAGYYLPTAIGTYGAAFSQSAGTYCASTAAFKQ